VSQVRAHTTHTQPAISLASGAATDELDRADVRNGSASARVYRSEITCINGSRKHYQVFYMKRSVTKGRTDSCN